MHKLKISGYAMACILLAGCFGSDDDVKQYVENIKKTSVGKVNELKPPKQVVVEEFNAKDLRSPFSEVNRGDKVGSMGDEEGEAGEIVQLPRPDEGRKKEYLEQYPLEEYQMVGTLSKEKIMWGLVQDKTGLVHPVTIGEYIGVNSGKVVSIDDTHIVVIETVENGEGGWLEQQSVLELKTEEQE